MRYTEDNHRREVEDLLDLVRTVFTSIVIAPHRLLSEVSKKIVYLDRPMIEKVLLVGMAIDTLMLVIDCVLYVITGKIGFTTGFLPTLSKLIALVVLGCLSWAVTYKFDKSLIFDDKSASPSSIEEYEVEQETGIFEEVEEEEVEQFVQTAVTNEVGSTEGIGETIVIEEDEEVEQFSVPSIMPTSLIVEDVEEVASLINFNEIIEGIDLKGLTGLLGEGNLFKSTPIDELFFKANEEDIKTLIKEDEIGGIKK
jgi:hypothetical protein